MHIPHAHMHKYIWECAKQIDFLLLFLSLSSTHPSRTKLIQIITTAYLGSLFFQLFVFRAEFLKIHIFYYIRQYEGGGP